MNQAAYTRNISYHHAIKVSPHEAVFGIKPHREILQAGKRQAQDENDEGTDQSTAEQADDNGTKWKKIIENQRKYNDDIIQQTKRKQKQKQPKFKISDMSDMVAIKINKVDKINPFHPNMLLGQIIEIEKSGYVRIVTEYGKVNTLITPSRFYPCIATNAKLDFSTKTSFTAACKKASGL